MILAAFSYLIELKKIWLCPESYENYPIPFWGLEIAKKGVSLNAFQSQLLVYILFIIQKCFCGQFTTYDMFRTSTKAILCLRNTSPTFDCFFTGFIKSTKVLQRKAFIAVVCKKLTVVGIIAHIATFLEFNRVNWFVILTDIPVIT